MNFRKPMGSLKPMRYRNPIYLGDQALEPPEELVMVLCTYCHKSSYSLEWRKNRGHCPLCQKLYVGKAGDDTSC